LFYADLRIHVAPQRGQRLEEGLEVWMTDTSFRSARQPARLRRPICTLDAEGTRTARVRYSYCRQLNRIPWLRRKQTRKEDRYRVQLRDSRGRRRGSALLGAFSGMQHAGEEAVEIELNSDP
jgi:hypothetical protein